MRTLFAKLRSLPRRTATLVAVLAAVVVIPAALWAWGPSDRVTFTWDKPADYVTFNSMTNNPKQGDERDFFKIRNVTDGGTFTDKISLVPGKEYEITAYYHNNASTTYNDAAHNYAGIATGAFMRVEMPELIKSGETGRMNAFIGASNAKHLDKDGNNLGNQVWDEVSGTNSTGGDILLRYVQNSATIRNNGSINGQQVDLNSLASSTGALLGYNAFDGTLPGCEEFSGFVTYRITVDQPDFELYKEVRKAGEGTWSENYNAKPGDEVEFRIQYKNTGTIKQEPVTINDKLPEGLTYVPGSTVYANTTTGGQWKEVGHDDIVKNGVNIGGYLPGGNAYVKFRAKVASENALKCGKNELVNNAYANTQNGTLRDTATVTVTKDCPEPEDKEIQVCRLSDKKYPVTIKESEFDAKKYSKDPEDCKDTPVDKDLTVCRLSDKKYPVTIKESEFDASKYSKDPEDCKDEPQPEKITVCDIEDKKVVIIDRSAYEQNKDRYTEDLTQCETAPTPTPEPETPTELPQTGASDTLVNVLGLSALTTAAVAYILSRRS